jgi:UDP-N-acetylmuramate--alanine ligase
MKIEKFIHVNNLLSFKTGLIHFSGIGGIGMSGIAEILHNLGCKVQGSDLSENQNIKRLRELGIEVAIGQKSENVRNSTVVVRSSAVKDNNPEIVESRKKNIPVIARAEMLAEIMKLKNCIAVAGTHGKTTTTSMISNMLEICGIEPTVINGGILNSCNTNAYLGSGDWLVAEADESDGSFSLLPANVAIVTNIDAEHMEHYGHFANLLKAFEDFVNRIPFYGFAVMCKDHPEVRNLMKYIKDRKIVSYALNEKADYQAQNVRIDGNGFAFDVVIANDKKPQIYKDFFLPMFGFHNVSNALAAIAVGVEMGLGISEIKTSFKKFLGVKRRLTVTGLVDNITIIDDYAHHPIEIKASIAAVKQMLQSKNKGNLIAVVQPHRYSRVLDLFDDFASCFADVDRLFVADIYAASEKPLEGINKESLAEAVRKNGLKWVVPLASWDELAKEVENIVKEDDVILFMGAGDITKYANEFPEKLKKIL